MISACFINGTWKFEKIKKLNSTVRQKQKKLLGETISRSLWVPVMEKGPGEHKKGTEFLSPFFYGKIVDNCKPL